MGLRSGFVLFFHFLSGCIFLKVKYTVRAYSKILVFVKSSLMSSGRPNVKIFFFNRMFMIQTKAEVIKLLRGQNLLATVFQSRVSFFLSRKNLQA